MRQIFLLVFFVLADFCGAFGQPNCVGSVSFTVGPQPINGTYAPGTVVNYCFTATGYSQAGFNWFEGFDINLGPGWVAGSITPVSPPANCGGGQGNWIWLNSSNAATAPFLTFGPGYFFDYDGNGIAGDDYGDEGSCTWTMCFNVTVGNVVGSSLLVGVAPLSDGIAGNYNNNQCDGINYTNPTPASVVVGGVCNVTGSITSQTNVLCFGASTGAVTVTGSLGTAPYQYGINGGAYSASNTFTGLSAGAYTVTIRDASNCTHNVAVTITQPATGLTGSIVAQTDVDCNGNATGSVDVSANNGVLPYQYGINGGTQSATTTFPSLSAGNYVVNVTDASGCTTDINVTINEPLPLTVTLVNQQNVDCFGNANASFEVAGSGGTAPYVIALNGGPGGVQTVFNSLAAGSYTITITDANACTASLTVVITEPSAPLAVQLVSNTPVDCFGASSGELSVTGVDGTAPYEYAINGGAFTASAVFTNLAAGNYTIVVRDANGCTNSITEIITQPAAALSGSVLAVTNVLCFGDASGSLSFTATNGTAPYSFSLSGNTNASGVFNNLLAGNYTVTISDANSCTVQVNALITEPNSALGAFILSQTNVLCSGTNTGEFEILGSNGTPPYSFTNAGVTNTSGVFSNLAAGIYNVTITDQNGCTFIQTVNLSSPNALGSAINTQTAVSCFGGSNGTVDVNGVNGTGPYSFSLNGNSNATGSFNGLAAGNYNVIVTDQNGCTVSQAVAITQPVAALSGSISAQTNISCFGLADASVTISVAGGTPVYSFDLNGTINNNGVFSALSAGNYQVTITDANACTAQVAVVITQPPVLAANLVSQLNVSCFGGNNGQINSSAVGGTLPYSFNLNASTNASGVFNALPLGAYTVVVTDQNLCTASLNVNITEPAAALSLNLISQTNVICFGAATGEASLLGLGGTAPYQYGISGAGLSASSTINGLTAGPYTFIVQDANACTATMNVIITEPALPVQVSLISQTDILCHAGNTGSLEVNASNGLAPYTYSIGTTNNTSGIFSNLTAGSYTVLIVDANNCTADIPVTLSQPAAPITITVINQTNPVCNGYSNGSIEVNASGGTAPAGYNFSWNTLPAVLNQQLINVSAGSYTVTVTDGNACSQTLTVVLTQPNFQLNVISGFSLCAGNDSSLTFTSLDGAPPVAYALTNQLSGVITNGTQQTLAPALTTPYQIIATDNNGCISPPMNFTVTVNEVPLAQFSASENEGCQPVCVDFAATAAPAGTTFNWSLGDGTTMSGGIIDHCFNEVGKFEVALQAVSSAGCSSFISIPDYISVYEIPLVEFSVSARVASQSDALITFTNQTNPDFNFVWNFGDGSTENKIFSPRHNFPTPGEYCIVLEAQNAAGCAAENKECITILSDFYFFIPSSFTPNGDGVNDTFFGKGVSIAKQDLKIYSRWGGIIFENSSTDGNVEWDGIGFQQDSYPYVFVITDVFGNTKTFTGNVTLLR